MVPVAITQAKVYVLHRSAVPHPGVLIEIRSPSAKSRYSQCLHRKTGLWQYKSAWQEGAGLNFFGGLYDGKPY
jgi:hypothetical protein